MKLHGEEVKVGDKVWHLFYGWGEVFGIDGKNSHYPICVQWEESDDWFTEDGKFHAADKTPLLFWQPIEFGIPKKPKQKEKAWQWVCKTGEVYWLTYRHFASEDSVLKSITKAEPNAEPIEPYLPSEIDREVKE